MKSLPGSQLFSWDLGRGAEARGVGGKELRGACIHLSVWMLLSLPQVEAVSSAGTEFS